MSTARADGDAPCCPPAILSPFPLPFFLPSFLSNSLTLSLPRLSLYPQVEEGSILKVTNVTLPKATFVKFRAQSVDFLEIQNPKVALEVTLRKFTCLTVGEIIRLDISRKIYQLEVVELRPGDAASIIETDCITDFAEPVGYVEPKRVVASDAAGGGAGGGGSSAGTAVRVPQRAKAGQSEAEANAFKPFAGQAKRIDGKGQPAAKTEAKDAGGAAAAPASVASAPASAAEGSVFGGVGRSLNGSVSGGGAAAAEAGGAPAAPKQHQSHIGDQFSKRKAGVSAFTGPGHKLT